MFNACNVSPCLRSPIQINDAAAERAAPIVQSAALQALQTDHRDGFEVLTLQDNAASGIETEYDGVDVSDVLRDAVKNLPIEAVNTLLLRGARGSEALVSAAISRDMNALARLVIVGADVTTALITLAKHSDKKVHYWAVKTLIAADNKQRRHDSYGKPRSETEALVRLAMAGDTATMTTLCRAVAPEHLGWAPLALSGNVEAIKVLLPFSWRDYPERYLDTFALRGHTMAVKTLIAAGVPTSGILTHLVDENNRKAYPNGLDVIKHLIAAGADASILPAEISEAINNRKTEISALSSDEKNVALLSAIRTENQVDVAMLLHQGANPIAVLRQLNPSNEQLSISRLITTGAISSQDVIDLAKAGDMATATVLAQIADILTNALGDLIAKHDQDAARALLAVSSCGYRALEQAVQRDDSYTATTLMAIGANGSEALLSLLKMGQREAAARLIALGVDIHTALMVAVRDDRDFHQNAIQELTAIGAEYSQALGRAIERRDAKAARQLLNQMDKQAGQKAVWDLVEDDALADEIKAARLRFLLQLEINTDDVLKQLVEDRAFVKLRLLITLGALTDGLLMDLGKQGNRIGAETLIRAGADYATAIAALKDNHEQDAVTVLTLSLTGARDRVMGGSAL